MNQSVTQPVESDLSRMQSLRREIGKAASGACNCHLAGGPLRENHAYACRYRALDAAMEFIDEQIALIRAPGVGLDDEVCDQVSAQAMDEVAAASGGHALHIDPNVTSNHALRRALVRAGARCASRIHLGQQPGLHALIAAADKVVLEAIDNRRHEVHVCDRENNDLAVRVCSQEIQALHAALKPRAALVQNAAPSAAETVQWRNIRKTVNALAGFCFGGPRQEGSVTMGAAYTSLVNALTAKDGLQVQLEPLPAAAPTATFEAKGAVSREEGQSDA